MPEMRFLLSSCLILSTIYLVDNLNLWLKSSRSNSFLCLNKPMSWLLKAYSFLFYSSSDNFYFPSASTENISYIDKELPSTCWILLPFFFALLLSAVLLLLPLLASFLPPVSQFQYSICPTYPFFIAPLSKTIHVLPFFPAFLWVFAAFSISFWDQLDHLHLNSPILIPLHWPKRMLVKLNFLQYFLL